MAAWNALTAEEKVPFEDLARESSAKYKSACNEFSSKFCDPPLRARHAYNCFMAAHGKTSDGRGGVCKKELIEQWQKLSDAQKAPYLEEARVDGERYLRETEEFRKWCTETGNNYDELIRKKKKIRAVPKSGDDPKVEKKSRKSTKKDVRRARKALPEPKKTAKKTTNKRKPAIQKKPVRKRAKQVVSRVEEDNDEAVSEAETYTDA
jgi:hypothetical protein